MLLFLVKKYWFEFVEVLFILSLLFYTYYLKNEVALQKAKVRENQAYIIAQNIAIESNRADYKAGLDRLPTVLKSIDTKYKTEVVTIEKWRDHNETHDCNSSMQFLNTYQF